MADDVVAPGDSVMAKIYALMERAAIVVADLSSKNALLEVGMVLSRDGPAKPLIIITDDESSIPFDVGSYKVIRRPRTLEDDSPMFIRAIESAFADAFSRISPALEDEPNRLLEKKEYRAAVISAFSLLEHGLRQLLEEAEPNFFTSRLSLMRLLEYALRQGVLSSREFEKLRDHARLRNRIAHSLSEVSAAQAKTIVRDVSSAMSRIRKQTKQGGNAE
jgi:hypothetical protein